MKILKNMLKEEEFIMEIIYNYYQVYYHDSENTRNSYKIVKARSPVHALILFKEKYPELQIDVVI